MDAVGGPDAKKARWSPTFSASATSAAAPTTVTRDAFANYGYGPHAQINQPFQPSSPAFSNQLYSTPNLTINTAVNGAGMNPQMSPAHQNAFAQQQQQHTPQPNGVGPYGGFGYNMLGMGLPGMNMLGGFPYGAQAGNYGQVHSIIIDIEMSHIANLISLVAISPALFKCQHSPNPRCLLTGGYFCRAFCHDQCYWSHRLCWQPPRNCFCR